MSQAFVQPELPVPSHFASEKVGEIWRVPYEKRAGEARLWANQQGLQPAGRDALKIALLLVDVQNTFCIPGFELYVGGRSGTGAVDDNRRLVEFIYRNLGSITHIAVTFDTHQAMQIFHAIFLVNDQGQHPAPYTLISVEDIRQGRWKFNPAVGQSLGLDPAYGQEFLQHYTGELQQREKYELTIWPYHAMLGGIGHALVPAVEEAVFFHTIARQSQPDLQIKGQNPLTEHYSALGPEILTGPGGEPISQKSRKFIEKLQLFDRVVIAGQAKSHCVAWTIDDLLTDIRSSDEALAKKVYLLEDCSSPVVVPGAIDYTEQADAAYRRFAQAGMNIVRSSDPLAGWPGFS